MSKKNDSREGMPRRALLKSALMVLGASVIVQPSGAVFGLAQDEPKQDNKKSTVKADSTVKTNRQGHIKGEGQQIKGETQKVKLAGNHIKGESKTNKTHKGTQKVKTETPKKEGS